jgi:hypothetical protein
MEKKQRGILIGSIIGALLGAGTAFLLMTAPSNVEKDGEVESIKPGDLLTLVGSAAVLIRRLDDIRRRT